MNAHLLPSPQQAVSVGAPATSQGPLLQTGQGPLLQTGQGPFVPNAPQGPLAPGVTPGSPGAPAYDGMPGQGYPANVQGCMPQIPALPPGTIVGSDSTYQECFVPLGFAFGVDRRGQIYPADRIGELDPIDAGAPGFQLFPRNGQFFIFGLKIFENNLAAGQAPVSSVDFESVVTGNSDWNHMLGATSAETWNVTEECFCPVQWGCISITNPLRIAARAVLPDSFTPNVIVGVRGVTWGIRRASAGAACGPCVPCGPGY